MPEFPEFDRTMDTLEELIDGIAEIMEGLVVPISAPTPPTTPIPSRNGPHPAMQPLIDRVTTLEAQVRTQRMQIDAILNSLTMTIEANDRLSTFIHSQQIQLSDVSSRFRTELTRQAVNLIQTLGIEEPTDPSPEDQFEYDEWRLGTELTYRTETYS